MQPDPKDFEQLPVLNRQALLDRVLGDQELAREILQIFRNEGQGRMTALRQALDGADPAAIRIAAHAINGSAGNIGAERVRKIAAAIESLARSGSLEGADAWWTELQQQMEILDRELAQVLAPATEAQGAGQ